jgi:hypothetical protein
MEVASAAISPLGFRLDLMEHKVLMRMRGGAQRGMVVLARGWSELEIGWMRAQEKQPQGCGEATTARMKVTGGRRRANGVNPDPSRSIYMGIHRIFPLRFLPSYNALQRLYLENFARRSRRIYRQQTKLRPKLKL